MHEKKFEQNGFHGEIHQAPVFKFFDKNSHVVFSAPHTTRTVINGKSRFSDRFTGAITMYLGEKTDFSTIVRQKFIQKEVSIIDFVTENNLEGHFFLDVHGMRADVPFELAVGTGYFAESKYEKQLYIIERLAKKFGIKWILNHENYQGKIGFTGKYQERYNQPNILQLEWRKDMRDFIDFPQNVINKTISFLKDLAQAIEDI